MSWSKIGVKRKIRFDAVGEQLEVSKRMTAKDKWDDDFYLELEPELKLAWDYLTLHCDGTGQIKISFSKLSRQIKGTPITREWLQGAFGARLHWITPEKIWIVGYIGFHYPLLNPNNGIHRNIVRKFLRESAKWTLLSEAAQSVRDDLVEFASQFSTDSHTTLIRESDDSRPDSLKEEIRKTKIENETPNSNSEEGVANFSIHADLVGDEVTMPVLRQISLSTQQAWIKAYEEFGLDWLRETIQSCVLHHNARSPEGVDQWGIKLTNWLAEERRRARSGKPNHGLLSAPKQIGAINFAAIRNRKNGAI